MAEEIVEAPMEEPARVEVGADSIDVATWQLPIAFISNRPNSQILIETDENGEVSGLSSMAPDGGFTERLLRMPSGRPEERVWYRDDS